MDKHKILVDLLFKRTSRGEIDWRNAVEQDAFQVSFADKSVILKQLKRKGPEGKEIRDYQIELTDDNGEVVDRFDDITLDFESGLDNTYYDRMSSLYNLALRTARGAEKVLNDILAQLEDDDLPF